MTQGSMETFLEELFSHVTYAEGDRNQIQKAETRDPKRLTHQGISSSGENFHAIPANSALMPTRRSENNGMIRSSSRSGVELEKKLRTEEQCKINSAMTNLRSYSKELIIEASSSSDCYSLDTSSDSRMISDCLVDAPGLSYIALISLAIQSAADKRMLLAEIYDWIENNFPKYQKRNKSWKNSIRHNLSLNECFVKRARSENGKGHYWSIHPANVDQFARGDFRRRHARRRAKQCGQSADFKTNLDMKVSNDEDRLEKQSTCREDNTEDLPDSAELDNTTLNQSKSEWYPLTNSCRYARNYIPMTCTMMSTRDLVNMFGAECVLP